MSKYIDADALIVSIPSEEMIARMAVASAPSIDIVRCGECKWHDDGQNESDSWSYCTRHFEHYIDVNADDFCSYGERSE